MSVATGVVRGCGVSRCGSFRVSRGLEEEKRKGGKITHGKLRSNISFQILTHIYQFLEAA